MVLVGWKWDLVVVDEAHRLRNVYKPANIIANVLKKAVQKTAHQAAKREKALRSR
jgi:hypothetical protein